MKYEMEDKWGREKARRLYGSAGMCAADVAAKRKNEGSEMTHKYPDTAREPTKASFPDHSESEKEK